jgi:hypothetical protein
LYDDKALYVGVHCYDTDPSAITQQMTRRDRSVQSDRFSVIIDSYHDHSTAFLFSGSVSGVISDGILSQDGLVYDVQWDAVWEFNAQITNDGWTAEYKIPFSALRFTEQDSEYVWGINFRRYIARKNETDEWVMVPRNETTLGSISSVSKMGHLAGLRNIHPSLHLELMPYVVSKESFLSQPDPFPLQKKFSATGGLDIKYGVANNFTLDVALNPDFGQVEVDQAVLNLTVFETYYPEKRPLFLEGAQIFSFGNTFDNQQLRLFYSRRIGKRPSSPVNFPDSGFTFVESPQTTHILGAGKFSGKTDNGLTIGLLTAVTDNEEGIEENLGGVRHNVLFEPRSSYNVLRVKQDILENSSIGIMTSAAFHDHDSPAINGGIDWNLRFNEGTYGVDGYLAGSQLHSPLGDRLSGGTGKLGIGKLEDDHWIIFSSYDFVTRNFSINDLGFFNKPLDHGGYATLTYKENYAADPIRRYQVTVQSDYRWNWDGAKTVGQFEIEPYIEFRNFWALTLDYIHDLPAHDDANKGIIGLYRRAEGNRFSSTLQSDIRQPVVVSLQTGYQTSVKNLSSFYATAGFTLRPSSWMEFAPSITFLRTRNEETWVIPSYTNDGANLFGNRDIDEYDFSLRGTLTFTRSVSLQFFTQVFLAKGRYTDFKKLAGAENLSVYDYVNSPSYSNPDFNEKILNANLVFRWEYLPGSTFFLVWTQERYGNNGLYNRAFSDNFSDAFRLPMDNVILAKISYWWSL